MEHLPTPLIKCIIGYLELYDLRSVIRTSKRLAFVVRSLEIDELVVQKSRDLKRTKCNLFYLNQPNNFLYMVNEYELGVLFPPRIRQTPLSNRLIKPDQLKRLRLERFDKCPKRIRLEELNQFSRLEILDIDLDNFTCKKVNKLYLPHLIGLRVYTFQTYCINFRTPRLKALGLCTYHTKSFEFSHPLALVHLETYSYNNDLAIFSNVIYLECFDSLDEEILGVFPKLRTLRIESRNSVTQLLQQRNAHERLAANGERRRLDIYQFGVLLKHGHELDSEMLNDYKRYYDLYLRRQPFYLRNYRLLTEPLRHAENMNYDQLADWIAAEHSDMTRFSVFYERFNDIRSVSVGKSVADRFQLIRLIYNSPNLCTLKLTDSGLDNRFYSTLPEISCLFCLHVYEQQYVGLNFEFIGRMKLLQTFRTNQDLVLTDEFDLDTVKHLRLLEFRINDRAILISVHRYNPAFKYLVRFENWAALAQKRTFAELVEWCTAFQNRDQDVIVTEYLNVNRPPRTRRSRMFKCNLM